MKPGSPKGIFRNALIAAALAGLLLFPGAASAGSWTDMITLSGFLSSDIRYVVEDYRGLTNGDGFYFSKNQNDLNLRMEIRPFDNVLAVAEPQLRFFGFNNATTLAGLTSRQEIDPYVIMLNEAYLYVKGFIHKSLDLKVGRMVQNWGSADIFNPTDNLSAHDFSDPLDYSAKVPNQMIELDWYPARWLQLTAVWVPVFKPSQLPDSALLGFAVTYKNGCVSGFPPVPLQPDQVQELMKMFPKDTCQLVFDPPQINLVLPESNLKNSQVGVRAKFNAGDIDISLSYYYGRFTFPVALDAYASVTTPNKVQIAYQADLMFPRMQVVGLDFAYSIPWLWNVGLVAEFGLFLPEKVIFALGSNYLDIMSTVNVPSTPFLKATVGLDYTFTKWLYANAMYVRGFIDEFNDMYGLHNYVVLAIDMKFFSDQLQPRISGILDCNDLSNVVYAQLNWIVVPSVELTLGALIFGGDTNPANPLDYASKYKFGQKAAGRDVVFFRAKATW